MTGQISHLGVVVIGEWRVDLETCTLKNREGFVFAVRRDDEDPNFLLIKMVGWPEGKFIPKEHPKYTELREEASKAYLDALGKRH